MSQSSTFEFDCMICCSSYNTENRRPLVGSCGHSMCELCRNHLTSPDCPCCTEKRTFKRIVLNRQVLDYVEKFAAHFDSNCDKSMKIKIKGTSCSECGVFCLDNELHVCQSCEFNEELFVRSSTGRIGLNLSNGTSEDAFKRARNIAICLDCALEEHETHKIMLLADLAKPSIVSHCSHLNMELAELRQEFLSSYAKVKEHYNYTEKLLDQIENASTTMSPENHRQEMKFGIGEIAMLNTTITTIAQGIKTTNDVLEHRINQFKNQIRATQPHVDENEYSIVVADKVSTNVKHLISIGVYDTEEEIWTSLGKLSHPCSLYSVASHDQKVYIVGGFHNDMYQNTLDMYSENDKIHRKCPPMKNRRARSSAAFHEGKLYVCGGYDGEYLNSVEVFDPVTNQWTAGPALTCKRADSGLVVFDGKLYVIGGHDGKRFVDKIERLNESEECFEIVGRMNEARAGFGCCSWNGRIFIAGGWSLYKDGLKTVQSYDPKSQNWSDEAPMSRKRKYLTLHPSNNALLAIRGCDERWKIIENIEKLDATSQVWHTMPCL